MVPLPFYEGDFQHHPMYFFGEVANKNCYFFFFYPYYQPIIMPYFENTIIG